MPDTEKVIFICRILSPKEGRNFLRLVVGRRRREAGEAGRQAGREGESEGRREGEEARERERGKQALAGFTSGGISRSSVGTTCQTSTEFICVLLTNFRRKAAAAAAAAAAKAR